jgi:tetratricopeptide (TPR) repeat protein
VDETLQHRRRHRAAWLSVSGAAVITSNSSIALDRDAGELLGQRGGDGKSSAGLDGGIASITAPISRQMSRMQLKRTLFSQESWFQTAAAISKEVLQAATQLWEQPDDVNCANLLFRLLVEEAYSVGADSIAAIDLEHEFVSSEIYMENRLPIRTLILEIPEANTKSGLAHFLAGHELALMRKHYEAIDAYLNAFLLSPNEPLIALTLSGYFLFLASHPLFRARYDNMLRALCFLIHYQKLRRRRTSASDTDANDYLQFMQEVSLYQETLYNLGRAFHDMKLHHLAVANYRKVLQLYDEHASTATTTKNAAIPQQQEVSCLSRVTREAAHNLVLLYRHSQAKDLALSIMLKYLRF